MVAEMVFTWLPLSKRIGTALFSMRAIEVSNAFEVRNSIGGATNGYFAWHRVELRYGTTLLLLLP